MSIANRLLLILIYFTSLLGQSNGFLNPLPSSISTNNISTEIPSIFVQRALKKSKLCSSKSEQIASNTPVLPNLKNNYYLLRHGQSTSNVAGRISSARSLANSTKHGLTALGYEQGKKSAKELLRLLQDISDDGSKRVFFYASPFARAKQTAYACLDGLKELQSDVEKLDISIDDNVVLEDGLMERFFGRLDNELLETYNYVWPVDMYDITHKAFDVESVSEVTKRMQETISKIDSQHERDNIVLVSHADVLQITQVYAAGLDNVGKFSQYRFDNGEVRFMGRNVDTLPEAKPLKTVDKGK